MIATDSAGPDLWAEIAEGVPRKKGRRDRFSIRPVGGPHAGQPGDDRPAPRDPGVIVMIAVWGSTWAAVVVAFCVCSTDGLDGYIARRQGATTSGAFLDPLADKAIVVGTYAVLTRAATSPGGRWG